MENLAINTILVPIDFSTISLNALNTAISIAKRQNARITLLHVIDSNSYMYITADGSLSVDFTLDSIIKDYQHKQDVLSDSVRKSHGIVVDSIVTVGFISNEIVKVAFEREIDLIVLGTHGVSGIRELFLGSNAYDVIKNSFCPVLTVPDDAKFDKFSRVLFPVRPVHGALEKYDFARKIIRKNKSQLFVLGLLEEGKEEQHSTLKEEMGTLSEKLEADEIDSSVFFYYGESVAKEILHNADDLGIDLLVITATLDFTIRDFFIGPFTQQIVNHAKVPVLSIRPVPALEEESGEDEDGAEDFQMPLMTGTF